MVVTCKFSLPCELEPIHESTAIPSQGLKTCKRCGETKSLEDFYYRGYRSKRNDGKRSLSNECKSCTQDRTKTRYYGPTYAEIREKESGQARTRRNIVKAIVFAKYSGSDQYRCACCGETELHFLTLDHKNNDGGEFRKKTLGSTTAAGYVTYRWLMLHGFPQDLGLQVLCANCQHGKRMNNGVCPHQARCNDYPVKGVEPSGSKRGGPIAEAVAVMGQDIVSSVTKVTAVSKFIKSLRELLEKYEILELEKKLEADLKLATRIED